MSTLILISARIITRDSDAVADIGKIHEADINAGAIFVASCTASDIDTNFNVDSYADTYIGITSDVDLNVDPSSDADDYADADVDTSSNANLRLR